MPSPRRYARHSDSTQSESPHTSQPNPWKQANSKRQTESRDELLSRLAEPWDEDRTRFKPELVLKGDTYRVEPLFDVPPFPADPQQAPPQNLLKSPHGEFAYMNRLWKRGDGIPLLQNRKSGIVYWDQDIVIPVLMDGRTLAVWMSLTPMEVLTLREGISFAKGTVVVCGLGMGYLLRKICAKSTVERVIVVESSQELLDWFGSRLCQSQPKITDVICGDAYEQVGKFGDQARYLFDIWPSYGDAAADPRFQPLKQSHKIWGWGDYSLPG